MTVWETRSEDETRRLGGVIAEGLEGGETLLLRGGMGSGKTVLAQGIGAALGVDPRNIQSPTFTLVHEHASVRGALFHLDLYRLDEEDFASLGLAEILDGPGIKLVEWPERLPEGYQACRCIVLEALVDGGRRIYEQSAPSLEGEDHE